MVAGGIGVAQAAEAPSLLGTWTGKGPSVSNSDGWETARSYTLVVTEQHGPVFKGRNEWPGGQEDLMGAIRATASRS